MDTLRRLNGKRGKLSAHYKPQEYTKIALAKYLGCESWDQLAQHLSTANNPMKSTPLLKSNGLHRNILIAVGILIAGTMAVWTTMWIVRSPIKRKYEGYLYAKYEGTSPQTIHFQYKVVDFLPSDSLYLTRGIPNTKIMANSQNNIHLTKPSDTLQLLQLEPGARKLVLFQNGHKIDSVRTMNNSVG